MLPPQPTSTKYLHPVSSVPQLRSRSIAASKVLQDTAPGRVHIRWNAFSGFPVSIRGILTESQSGVPEEIASRFLEQHAELFGLLQDNATLTHVETTAHRGVQHVHYQQELHRIPVMGARLSVHIDAANRVCMVNGNYCPGIAVDVSASMISASAAIQSALEMLHSPEHGTPQAELVIFPKDDRYVRAYQVNVSSGRPLGDWVFFLDAATGETLDSYNALKFEKGRGMVYNTNPERDNQVVTAELFDLNETKTLSGAYFTIKNAAKGASNAVPTTAGTYDFLYQDPADPHFDEVMAYYHLSKVARFFRNFGYKKHDAVMLVHVHTPDPETGNANYDNAYYSPLKRALFFGHGKELNDLAKEAAVIYHEYTHSVIDALQPLMATIEAGALHEGYADYFGCSLTEDPEIGEYVVKKLGQDHLRDLRQNRTYDTLTKSNVHRDGEIWGCTCWKIREALGRQVADLLIYESLWYLPPNATFFDAADGILQAEAGLFNNEHLDDLTAILSAQKIEIEPAAKFTLVAKAGNGGRITPSGAFSLKIGGSQTFSIAANTGYYIKHVLVDGVSVGAVESYTFNNIAASHTLEAFFEDASVSTYTITASAGTGGGISPSGKIAVTQGKSERFTFVPENDYALKHVLVDGVSVGAVREYLFENISASHTIEAIFIEDVPAKDATVIVPGSVLWTDSGVNVLKGDVLRFSASGKVVYDTKGNACGPAGTTWTDAQGRKDPLWQKPHAGLIGKIEGVGAPFFIGASYAVKAGSSGKLLLGVNDFWYQGNRGEFTVTIRITRGTS
ncbi:propeptide peptidase M4 and M36 [Candidatus Moduliflexus flocculans]|uniref:Propeptide peptidase M4 and M36 n=1 Tax=Candidatus Moduliflexus flocculans TaxID=1499966 RepID=A0A0S6VPY8_9BACT|nr:propeptide peptidase M4 and M36 [Candidatus Moduliflexus flocculans]